MNRMKLIGLAAASLTWMLAGCGKPVAPAGGEKTTTGPAPKPAAGAPALKKPHLLFRLDELSREYNSPDGMTIGKDGCIYLSMNNNDGAYVGRIMRITPADKLEEVVQLPPHPDTGVVSPLGIGFGPDGNLYVADNQDLAGKGMGKSRLLRVVMKDGKAERVEVLVTGMNAANGLAIKGDEVFVNETNLGSINEVLQSGTYRFKLAELDPASPLKVTGAGDPHLILTLKTYNKTYKVGANGLAFDSKGNLYVCNFGDRELVKVVFDSKGTVAQTSVLAKDQGMESLDGMQADAEDNLWIADFIGNAIVKVEAATGKVTIVAKNAPGDGADGSLDAPSECIRRGNKVYVSNIDLTFGPNENDKIVTMSVIDL